MKIKIYIEDLQKEQELDFQGSTIKDLADFLNIDLSQYLVLKNKKIALEDEKLEEGDYIEFLNIVSGG